MRGESPLWSVAMITACVALIAVSVVAVWVAQRGGHIDVADEAIAGVGNAGRAWASAAAAGSTLLEPAADAGAAGTPDAASEPVDAGADATAAEGDAGAAEEEESDEPDAGPADAAAPAAKVPPKKKKPIKKPRRR